MCSFRMEGIGFSRVNLPSFPMGGGGGEVICLMPNLAQFREIQRGECHTMADHSLITETYEFSANN